MQGESPVFAPSKDFHHSTQLWVGRPKVGKTSTAAALGTVAKKYGIEGIDPFFVLCEAGTGGVSMRGSWEDCPCGGETSGGKGKRKSRCPKCGGLGSVRHIVSSFEDAKKWMEYAAASPYNPIVVDTGDALYQTISDSVCVRLGVRSPSEVEHGIAWMQIFDDMRELLATVLGRKAVILLQHVYEQERRGKGGSIIRTQTFNVSGKTRQYLAGCANQILFFDIVPSDDEKGDRHVLVAEARAEIEAGDHWGVFPPQLDLGRSAEEAAEAMLEAWGFLERK